MTQAIKVITAITCAVAIFLFTSTSSLEALLSQGTIHFKINHNIQFNQLLDFPSTIEADYIWRKIGHALCFFILTLLLLSICNWIKVLTIGICLAVVTELLQPLFSRDGRILDMVWDTAGILMAIIFYIQIYSKTKKQSPTNRTFEES
ncbi:VanZ family protein [Bacillus carboniphilus]|uniref:VanZ family protein n=1 Tax=Bacillus carboniphilus TaxID=86663 RepID=UPI0031D4E79C